MNGYISKPVQPAHLITTLERHLAASEVFRTARRIEHRRISPATAKAAFQ